MAKRLHGEGTIWHDKNRGRYEARITIGIDDRGRAIRKKVTARTKAEVRERLKELQRAQDDGDDLARADLTVRRFLDDWLANVLPGTVAGATEANYRNVVKLYLCPPHSKEKNPHGLTGVGSRRLRSLRSGHVTAMLRQMEDAGLSRNSQRLARSVLRRALRYAQQEGMVSRNVAALADGVKVGSPEAKALDLAQARQLLAYLEVADDGEPHRLAGAFTVALSLGLRRGELLGLSWDDLELDTAPPRLRVRNALKRLPSGLVLEEPKTRQSRRTVHLPPPVVNALRRHRVRQAEERLRAGDLWTELPLGADLVFRTETGTSLDPDNFRNLTYKITEAAGIGRWSPHSLRHSAASLLLAQGVPLKVISDVLGHSSIRVTSDVYAHLQDEAKAEAASAMESALWGSA